MMAWVEGEYYCRQAPDASWQGHKGNRGEWVEQLQLFIAEPTEKVFSIKKHTGPDSCRYVWI